MIYYGVTFFWEKMVQSSFEKLSGDDKSARLLDYVHGRISDTEKHEIDAAIANDASLAEELAYYEGLANATDEPERAADHEFGWAKLSKSIDAEASNTPTVPAAANDNLNFWKVATLALGLVVAAQAAFLVGPLKPAISEDPVYIPVAEAAEFGLQVIFIDGATSASMNQLLNDLDAEIVAGPSAIGLYDIRFESESSRDAGLITLRSVPDIIESATLK